MVKVDETYISGRRYAKCGRGSENKNAVFGTIEDLTQYIKFPRLNIEVLRFGKALSKGLMEKIFIATKPPVYILLKNQRTLTSI